MLKDLFLSTNPAIPSRLGALLFFSLAIAVGACQGGGSDGSPDSGTATGGTDGSPTSGDANTSGLADAASVSDDAGFVSHDAGPVGDGGVMVTDGGVTDLDGGVIVTDGGVVIGDGGVGGVAEVCQKICGAIAGCFGQDNPSCVAECSGQIGLVCSQEEIDQVGSCANGDCTSLELCLSTIDCLADGGETCGDGICDAGESCSVCPQDCGPCVCGDSICSPGECSSCVSDCPSGCSCGDVCTTGPAQDPSCDPCQATVCNADAFCCEQEWDGLCVNQAETLCGMDCPAFCGDFNCDPNESIGTCPEDCDPGPPPTP